MLFLFSIDFGVLSLPSTANTPLLNNFLIYLLKLKLPKSWQWIQVRRPWLPKKLELKCLGLWTLTVISCFPQQNVVCNSPSIRFAKSLNEPPLICSQLVVIASCRQLSRLETWGENCNSTSQPPSSSFTRLSFIKFTTTVQIGSPFHCAQINHRCSWCRASQGTVPLSSHRLLTYTKSIMLSPRVPSKSLLKCADVREIANNFAKMSFMDFSRLTMQFPMDMQQRNATTKTGRKKVEWIAELNIRWRRRNLISAKEWEEKLATKAGNWVRLWKKFN